MSKKDIKILIALFVAMIVFKIGSCIFTGIVEDVSNSLITVIILPIIIYIISKLIRDNEDSKVYAKFFIIYIFLNYIINFLREKIYISDVFNKVFLNGEFELFALIGLYGIILKLFKNKKNAFEYSIIFAIIVSLQNFPKLIDAFFYYLPFAVLGYNKESNEKIEKAKLNVLKLILSIIGLVIVKLVLNGNAMISYRNIYVHQYNIYITILAKSIIYNALPCILCFIYNITNIKNKNINLKFENLVITFVIIEFLVNKVLGNIVYGINFGYKSKILYVIISIIFVMITLVFLTFGEKIKKDKVNNKLVIRKKYISPTFILPVILLVSIFVKQVTFAMYIADPEIYKDIYILFIFIAEAMLLILPMFILKKTKSKYNYLLIVNLIFSIITISNLWYYRYQSNLISINQVQNAKYVNEIFKTLIEIVRVGDFIFFIDVIFLFIIKKKLLTIFSEEDKSLIYKLCIIILLYLATYSYRNVAYISIKESPYLGVKGELKLTSLIGYYIIDINNLINNECKYKSYEEFKEDYIKYKENVKSTNLYGIAKDKNVLIIQLEAMQNFLVDAKINGKEILPNINKFLKENTNISNMHAQSYTTTADSEFSFSTGVLPLENGQSFARNFDREYYDIYSILNENGYYTAFSHGNVPEFWNRNNVYKAFEVNKTIFIDDFKNDKNMLANGYLLDEVVYEQTIEAMKKYPNKYLQTISTASSHTPFKLEGMKEEYRKEVVNIDVGKYKDTFFGNYLEACNYADYAFGKFLENLKSEGVYEDMVIMIFGDHYGIPLGNNELKKYFSEEKNIEVNTIIDKYNFTNVLAGIKVPGVDIKEIKYPTSKIDVKSTILDLLGIDEKFSLGFSVFASKDRVSTNNNLIITDKYFFDEIWYNLKTFEPLDLENLSEEEKIRLENIKREMIFKTDVSKSIGYNNILKLGD